MQALLLILSRVEIVGFIRVRVRVLLLYYLWYKLHVYVYAKPHPILYSYTGGGGGGGGCSHRNTIRAKVFSHRKFLVNPNP